MLLRFVSIVTSQPSSAHSWIGPSPNLRPLMPATLKSASIRWYRVMQLSMARVTSPARVRSAMWKPHPISSANALRLSLSRLTTKTDAPSLAASRAVAAPMPVEPVIRQTLFASLPLIDKDAPGCGGRHRKTVRVAQPHSCYRRIDATAATPVSRRVRATVRPRGNAAY
ncbi:MAG: hypothetical protein JMDDDDMK_01685 [Acidobacteria bacterium]|nr:hypothetical protein [Acidobacteriota bacterium]